jgi:nitroreductase
MNMTIDQKLGLLLGRRSIRVYSPGAIPDETITKLLEAAMAAPSAMTKDPWRFVIIRDLARLSALATALPGGKMLSAATVGILVCGDLEYAFEQNLGYLVQDCCAAIQNLLLAAHFVGLGACWVGIYPAESSMKQVRAMFGTPGSMVPIACVALGWPGEQLEPRTRFIPASVRHEKW